MPKRPKASETAEDGQHAGAASVYTPEERAKILQALGGAGHGTAWTAAAAFDQVEVMAQGYRALREESPAWRQVKKQFDRLAAGKAIEGIRQAVKEFESDCALSERARWVLTLDGIPEGPGWRGVPGQPGKAEMLASLAARQGRDMRDDLSHPLRLEAGLRMEWAHFLEALNALEASFRPFQERIARIPAGDKKKPRGAPIDTTRQAFIKALMHLWMKWSGTDVPPRRFNRKLGQDDGPFHKFARAALRPIDPWGLQGLDAVIRRLIEERKKDRERNRLLHQ